MTLQHLYVFAAPGLFMFIFLLIVYRLSHRRIVIPQNPAAKNSSAFEEFLNDDLEEDDETDSDEEDDEEDDTWERRHVYLPEDDLTFYESSWFLCFAFFFLEFLLFPFIPNNAVNQFAAPHINALLSSLNQSKPDYLLVIIGTIVLTIALLLLVQPFFNLFIRRPIEEAFAEIWRHLDASRDWLAENISSISSQAGAALSRFFSRLLGGSKPLQVALLSIWFLSVAAINVLLVVRLFGLQK